MSAIAASRRAVAALAGFLLGVLVIALVPGLPDSGAVAALLALASLSLLASLRWCPCLAATIPGMLLGVMLAQAYGQALLASRLDPQCEGRDRRIEVSGTVVGLPVTAVMPDETRRQRFELAVDGVHPPHCAGLRRVAVTWYAPMPPRPGERWRMPLRLKRPWGLANPGAYNAQDWFARRGIDALGTVPRRAAPQRLASANGWRHRHHRLRQEVADRLGTLDAGADTIGLLRALAVADHSALSPRMRSLFQYLGVSHLLVISGLHIGLVGGLGLLLGGLVSRLCGQRDRHIASTLCALALAGGYAGLAAFSLPTQRALLMLTVFLFARASGRRVSGFYTLLLAAVVVVAVNPLAPTGSGFWLSFGAVLALLWCARWQPAAGPVRTAVRTQGYLSLVMLPLTGWFFGAGSLVAPLANLLLIPLVGCVVVPLVLAGVACVLLGLPWETLPWRAAAVVMHWVIVCSEQAIEWAGDAGWFAVSPDRAALLLAATGVCLAALPGRRRAPLWPFLLLPLLMGQPGTASLPADRLRVSVLDVGQGTAVVVRAGRRVLLYDTGGGVPGVSTLAASVVLPYLAQAGVSELDTFIISHGDLDHSAGTADVLAALPVRRLRVGRDMSFPAGRRCRAGESWRWPGGVEFRLLSPALEGGLGDNDMSCVLQVRYGDHSLLLLGDIGHARERELVAYWRDELRAGWLLLGHHGSATSSSRTLLRATDAAVGVLSRGYANPFGHPHPDVLDKLAEQGVDIADTAHGGALTYEFHRNGEVTLERWRDRDRRYWR